MQNLEKDTQIRNLGRKEGICKICHSSGKMQHYLAREMMYDTRDEFEYLVCERCGCLQIKEIPGNLGDYYGKNYYSFSLQEDVDVLTWQPICNEEMILDVGCGSGEWLVQKAKQGYGRLYGCDPFLEKDLSYGDRVCIYKCSIHEIEGEGIFDKIRMADSFEHMTDPLETLKSVRRLLKVGGELIMHIPTFPNIAFDLFETHWYQLDAPRHIFLHSKKSLQYLSQQSGLKLDGMYYDSNNMQIIRSFFYQHGVSFFQLTKELIEQYFTAQIVEQINQSVTEANEQGYGDAALVLWKRES